MFQLEFILCAETCRVPGRATGELVRLDQRDIVPTELCQVIEHTAALYAAADHQHSRFDFASSLLTPRRMADWIVLDIR